jgi:hypothetical protein
MGWLCHESPQGYWYPYPIDAHSLHPIDFAADKALLHSRASSLRRDLTVLQRRNSVRQHVPSCVLTIAGFGALPISSGRLVVFAVARVPFAGVLPASYGCACAPHLCSWRRGVHDFSITVICVVEGPLVMNIISSLCPALAHEHARFPLCLPLGPNHAACLIGSRTSAQLSALSMSVCVSP